MNYEDLNWINQSLFSYKDKMFETNGYLDLSVSLNTTDNLNFSKPTFNFTLDNNNQRRLVRLSYINVVDLLDSFNSIIKNVQTVYNNPEGCNITKRYNQGKDLVFIFQKEPNSGQFLVAIEIVLNYSDKGRIILPLAPEFVAIGKFLRIYERDYSKFCLDMPSRYLASLSVNRLAGIENSIKTLPSQIAPIQPEYNTPNIQENISSTNKICSICGQPQFDTPSGLTCSNGHGGADSSDEDDEESSLQMQEFEQFAETEEPNIKIPELESDVVEPKEPITQEYTSRFINDVLKNNIYNLQEMLFALTTNDNPLITIMNNIHGSEGYVLLPGVSEQDLKSVFYISNMYFKLGFQSYIQSQQPLPVTLPAIKTKVSETPENMMELCYDSIMISAYLKCYRSRLEGVESDAYINGALVHYSFRCFMDVISYSFINGHNHEAIKNNIISRYKYFKEVGFFGYYDSNLTSNNQKEINISEIIDYVDKILENIDSFPLIDERHKQLHKNGNCKIPYENNFSSEQITNELVKIELKTMFGQRVEDLTNDAELIAIYGSPSKKQHVRTNHNPAPRQKQTHILRYIKLKANEIPESYRENFLQYIEELGNEEYDYFNDQFQIEELSETIIQAIYIWNDIKDDGIKYTDYVVQVETCIDKDLIISKIKEEENIKDDNSESSGDWTSTLEEVNF